MEFSYYIQAILFFFAAFGISYFVLPAIINVVKLKRLYEKRNDRSSHHNPTPSFGGISLFVVLVLALSMAEHLFENQMTIYVITGLTILFFVGLKDAFIGQRDTTRCCACIDQQVTTRKQCAGIGVG